jgi:hypothetical protein
MSDQFTILAQHVGELQDIQLYVHPDHPMKIAAVKLCFSDTVFFIGVDDETDSILMLDQLPVWAVKMDSSEASEFLQRARGMRLGWVWRLENQQGYWDGVQFRFFLDQAGGAQLEFQFEAIGSSLTLKQCVVFEA